MNDLRTNRDSSLRQTLIVGLTALLLVAGCASTPDDSRAKQSAKSGAAIGAGIGLLLGVLSGDPEKAVAGVAVGAGIGAGQGAYEGWRQDQDDERTRQLVQAINANNAQQAATDAEERQREELTRFLGVWQMSGWVVENGRRLNVSAQVNGNVVMGNFVEMAWIDLKAEGFTGQIWGTSTLGYTQDKGFELSTRFNTLADSLDASGGFYDAGSRSFTWSDAAATTTIRFETPDRFTAETRANGETVESYRFTRS